MGDLKPDDDEPYFALVEYRSGQLGGKAMSDEARLAFLAGFRAGAAYVTA